MPADPWVIMPVMAHPTYTKAAISDVLTQTLPCRLLLINQGVDTPFRLELEQIAEDSDRVFIWSHQPPLPSLAATWNRALDFAWETGATEALVINNDVRLSPNTLELLRVALREDDDALLVTGVGVSPKQFQPGQLSLLDGSRGGPDFSCFLVGRDAHAEYRFDEHFIPAYCEDLDLHRRMLLDGNGHRIFSVNVPFLHYGSTTLKTVDEKTRAQIERRTAEISRAHYRAKWGGEVNEERFTVPFGEPSAAANVTTPELQEDVWASASKS
jgi:GT2 family glycosyltransferase